MTTNDTSTNDTNDTNDTTDETTTYTADGLVFVDEPTTRIGCYIGGHHGIYSPEILATIVDDLTNELPKTTDYDIMVHALRGDHGTRLPLRDENGDQYDYVTTTDAADILHGEIVDDWTDALPAADGFAWYWHDGELFFGRLCTLPDIDDYDIRDLCTNYDDHERHENGE